jgi:hypothetical protein
MKYINVLGIQNSGSSAVYDYLVSRNDCEAPFGANEFKLCVDPMGLHNLYLNFYKNYSFMSASNARFDFLNYTNKLESFFVYESKGVKKRLYNKNFDIISEDFINNVTKSKFYARPEFSNFKISKFENFLLKIKKNYFSFFPIIIPEQKEKFIIESKKYINNIIQNNLSKKLKKNSNIILNQSVNIFDPIESSNYFENSKIIYVTRDPRDMFSSMKSHQSGASPCENVNLFIEWYKHYFDNDAFKKKLKHKDVLHVKFKDFVTNFKKENLKICRFLGINSKFKFKKDNRLFDLKVSKKNLTKYINYLSKNENDLIKKKLNKFLQR